MRIAHISDIHADTSTAFQKRFRDLLQFIRTHRADHLVITGDLTDKALPDEYDTVIRILKEFDYSSGENLTVIPGNHDLYPAVYQSFTFRLSTLREEFREDPVRITKELYRVLRAYRKFTPQTYRDALRTFVAHFKWSFDDAMSFGTEKTGGFPYVKHLNDDFAIVCIESNYVSPHIKNFLPYALVKYAITKDMFSVTDSPICSNGWIDTGLFEQALSHPAVKNKQLIVLLHHYLYPEEHGLRYMSKDFERTMSLVNKDEFLRVVRESNTAMLLHGHWHITEAYSICNGTFTALNGAGSIREDNGKWNILDLSANKVNIDEVHMS